MNTGDAIYMDLAEIGKKFDALQAGLTDVKVELAGLRGSIESDSKTHAEQIRVLFDQHRAASERIGRIEQDYVPKRELASMEERADRTHVALKEQCDGLRDECVERLNQHSTAIGEIRVRMGWFVIAGVILGALIGPAANYFFSLLSAAGKGAT